jgi:hypothetical protein
MTSSTQWISIQFKKRFLFELLAALAANETFRVVLFLVVHGERAAYFIATFSALQVFGCRWFVLWRCWFSGSYRLVLGWLALHSW